MTVLARDASGNGPSAYEVEKPLMFVKGTFGSTGSSTPLITNGKANINIQKAAGSATVDIEKSFDNGSSYNIVSKDADGADASYATSVDFNGSVEEIGEGGVWYRLTCSTYGSGTVTYRMSRAD
jgi:hypothetical protein